jgi:hypothetical protein
MVSNTERDSATRLRCCEMIALERAMRHIKNIVWLNYFYKYKTVIKCGVLPLLKDRRMGDDSIAPCTRTSAGKWGWVARFTLQLFYLRGEQAPDTCWTAGLAITEAVLRVAPISTVPTLLGIEPRRTLNTSKITRMTHLHMKLFTSHLKRIANREIWGSHGCDYESYCHLRRDDV